MLTKIRDGWWVNLDKVYIYEANYNLPPTHSDKFGFYHLSCEKEYEFYFDTLEDAQLFEQALEKYYYLDSLSYKDTLMKMAKENIDKMNE